MHSGWGVLVAISEAPAVLDRRRIIVIGEAAPGGKMPFHHAEKLGLPKAEKYLAHYAGASQKLARRELEKTVDELRRHGHRVVSAGLVLASGKPVPALANILASHPLIHTAEGELFRDSIRIACEGLSIPVSGYRERDLAGLVEAESADALLISGKRLGPPWTADHKCAALAAWIALKEALIISTSHGRVASSRQLLDRADRFAMDRGGAFSYRVC